jgi:hypothetical protein
LIADAAKDIDPEIETAWGDEALRRIKEMEDGKVQGIPGDVVAAKIHKIVGREINRSSFTPRLTRNTRKRRVITPRSILNWAVDSTTKSSD